MELSEISIGTKIEIEVIDNSGTRAEPTYTSKLERIEAENKAAIAAPIYKGDFVNIPIGSIINVFFIKQDKRLVNLYKFRAQIKGTEELDKLRVLIIEKTSDIEKVQRRNHFRLACLIDVKYRVVNSFNDKDNYGIPFNNAVAVNISGGGIGLLLDEEIDKGSYIECKLLSDKIGIKTFYGRVLRCEKTEKEGITRYEAGVSYVKINEKDKEEIIRFIFEEQRRLLRKGLI